MLSLGGVASSQCQASTKVSPISHLNAHVHDDASPAAGLGPLRGYTTDPSGDVSEGQPLPLQFGPGSSAASPEAFPFVYIPLQLPHTLDPVQIPPHLVTSSDNKNHVTLSMAAGRGRAVSRAARKEYSGAHRRVLAPLGCGREEHDEMRRPLACPSEAKVCPDGILRLGPILAPAMPPASSRAGRLCQCLLECTSGRGHHTAVSIRAGSPGHYLQPVTIVMNTASTPPPGPYLTSPAFLTCLPASNSTPSHLILGAMSNSDWSLFSVP